VSARAIGKMINCKRELANGPMAIYEGELDDGQPHGKLLLERMKESVGRIETWQRNHSVL
jgi:hypothetical protein